MKVVSSFLLALVFTLTVSSVWAQTQSQSPETVPAEVQKAAKAVHRIQKGNAFLGGSKQASMFFLTPSVAVTAYHYLPLMVQDASFAGTQARIIPGTGPNDPLANPMNYSRYTKKSYAFRSDMDFTLLDFGKAVTNDYLTISMEPLKPGEMLYLIGSPVSWGPNEKKWPGEYSGMFEVRDSNGNLQPFGLLKATHEGKEGVSGGAVVNKKGQVVGVFCHMDPSNGNQALFTPIQNLVFFVRKNHPEIFAQLTTKGVYPFNGTYLEYEQFLRSSQEAISEGTGNLPISKEEMLKKATEEDFDTSERSATDNYAKAAGRKIGEEVFEEEPNLFAQFAGDPKTMMEALRGKLATMNNDMVGLSTNAHHELFSTAPMSIRIRGAYRITVSDTQTDSKTGQPFLEYRKLSKDGKVSARITNGVEAPKWMGSNSPGREYRGELLDPVINPKTTVVPAGIMKNEKGEELHKFYFKASAADKVCFFAATKYGLFSRNSWEDAVDCEGEVWVDDQFNPRYVKRTFLNVPQNKATDFVRSGAFAALWYDWKPIDFPDGRKAQVLLPAKLYILATFTDGYQYGSYQTYEDWFLTEDGRRKETLKSKTRPTLTFTNVRIGKRYEVVKEPLPPPTTKPRGQ